MRLVNQSVWVDVEAMGRPDINVDKHKLSQVVRNLVSNALKFSPAGSEVVVSVRRETSSTGVVDQFVVDVVDQGAGISKVLLTD